MATTEEILKKVTELEIKSKRLTRHLFKGEYHSAFKGRGMHFKEVREYEAGDDIRFIDWNVSARLGHAYSKIFEEERELTVMLMVDVSASFFFGTQGMQKNEMIAEMASVLAFAAISNNDKVGLLLFSDVVEKYIPPKKGRNHILHIVRTLLTHQPKSTGTNLQEALKILNSHIKRESICFLLTDFFDDQYQDTLRAAAKKYDLIGINLYDTFECHLPDIGWIELFDAETKEYTLINSSDPLQRKQWFQTYFDREQKTKQQLLQAGAEYLHINTNEDYVKKLHQFFRKRHKSK